MLLFLVVIPAKTCQLPEPLWLSSFHKDFTGTSQALMSGKIGKSACCPLWHSIGSNKKTEKRGQRNTSIFISAVLGITGGHWGDLQRAAFPANTDSFLS